MASRPRIAVVSDLHLGTPECRAEAVGAYLRSIEPEALVLGGDIIDLPRLRPRCWPAAHAAVLERIMALAAEGCAVHYLTGNHDDALRRWWGQSIAGVRVAQRLELDLDGVPTRFEHGHDTGRPASWFEPIATVAYDLMIAADAAARNAAGTFGLELGSFAGAVKRWTPGAAAFIDRFERETAARAAAVGFAAVVCGHIHEPRSRVIDGVHYLNSGDWAESCSALEYDAGWRVVRWDAAQRTLARALAIS